MEIPLEPMNEDQRPAHPRPSRGFWLYDVPLEAAQCPSELLKRVEGAPLSLTSSKPTNNPYATPQFSRATKKLLQEVDNLRMRQLPLLEAQRPQTKSRSRKRRIVDFTGSSRSETTTTSTKATSSTAPATSAAATTSSTTNSREAPPRVAEPGEESRWAKSPKLELQDIGVQTEECPKPSRARLRFCPPPAMDSGQTRSRAKSEDGSQPTPSSYSPPKRSKSEDSSFDWGEHRRKLREKREDEKPWRTNMRLASESDKNPPAKVEPPCPPRATRPPLKIASTERKVVPKSIDLPGKLPAILASEAQDPAMASPIETNEAKDDHGMDKPWRANMKSALTMKDIQHEEELLNKKLRESDPEVQKYMLDKRKRTKLQELRLESEQSQRSKAIKQRLLALEMKRREEYRKSILEKKSLENPELGDRDTLDVQSSRNPPIQDCLETKLSGPKPEVPVQKLAISCGTKAGEPEDRSSMPSNWIKPGQVTKALEQDALRSRLEELTNEMRQRKIATRAQVGELRIDSERPAQPKTPESVSRAASSAKASQDQPERDPESKSLKSSQKLKLIVSEIFQRHQRDLETIKNSNLGIEIPEASQLFTDYAAERRHVHKVESTEAISVSSAQVKAVSGSTNSSSRDNCRLNGERPQPNWRAQISESDYPFSVPRDPLSFLSSVTRKGPLIGPDTQSRSKTAFHLSPQPSVDPTQSRSRGEPPVVSDGSLSEARSAAEKRIQDDSDDNVPSVHLSEGPLSTSISSVDNHDGQGISEKNAPSHRACVETVSKKKKNPPVTTAHRRKEGPREGGGEEKPSQMRVSDALSLRFRAEMDHLESMAQVDKQLDQLKKMKEVSNNQMKSADVAAYIQSLQLDAEKIQLSHTTRRSESKSEFEARLRQEFQAILDAKMRKLVETQAEAAAVRANAAQQLDRLNVGSDSLARPRVLDKPSREIPRTAPKKIRHQSEALFKASKSDHSETKSNLTPRLRSLMMSTTNSKMSEVLSALEGADKSAHSIPQTISEALAQLSSEEPSTSHNVTEAIAKELSEYSNTFEKAEGGSSTLKEFQQTRSSSTYSTRDGTPQSSDSCDPSLVISSVAVRSAAKGEDPTSFQVFARNLELQQMVDESRRAQHQYQILKQKELDLIDKARVDLAFLKEEKKKVKNDVDKVSSLKKRERGILLDLEGKRKEIHRLKRAIQIGEKERKAIMKQYQKLFKGVIKSESTSSRVGRASNLVRSTLTSAEPSSSSAPVSSVETTEDGSKASPKRGNERTGLIRKKLNTSDQKPSFLADSLRLNTSSRSIGEECKGDDGDTSTETASTPHEESQHTEEKSSTTATGPPPSSPSKMDSLKKSFGSLKTPLSPKLGAHRRRRSSAESDESLSISQADTVSDHSDVDIRIHTLQDELKKRMLTAAKLKRQQRVKKKEKLRIQENTLRKQIEQYDKLIEETRNDLIHEETHRPPAGAAPTHVPPQIKTPKHAPSGGVESQVAPSVASTTTAAGPIVVSVKRSESPPSISLASEPSQTAEAPNEALSQSFSLATTGSASTSTHTAIVTASLPKAEELSHLGAASLSGSQVSDVQPQSEDEPSVLSGHGEDDPSEYSDDFTLSNPNSEAEVANVASDTADCGEKKRSDYQLDVITDHILEELILDACQIVSSTMPDHFGRKPSAPLAPSPGQPPRRPQDLMLTTFDISSDSSDEDANKTTWPSGRIPEGPRSGMRDEALENDNSPDQAQPDNNEVEDEEFQGNFIDDDYGLTSIAAESERIRQQQQKIEEEIKRIHEEAAGQGTVPTQPPPPYSPPVAQPSLPPPPPPSGSILKYSVPNSPEELVTLTEVIAEAIFEAREAKIPLDCESLLPRTLVQSDGEESPQTPSAVHQRRRIFSQFLIDLVQEIVEDIYRAEQETQNPPWLPPKPISKERLKLPQDSRSLCSRVRKEVLVYFGFQKRSSRENLIVRWSQKRRDRVDHILVRELHAEEAHWTDYSQDEAVVKDQLHAGIWNILLADTTRVVTNALKAYQ
eukprot:maker-scaffold308_size214241-snap-gene-1.46 protein:Tk09069 transcript:maker-scaffold308_size214241-snap-gene-1.46-mRNA-1 annotation:"centrosome-associated protein 350-like"